METPFIPCTTKTVPGHMALDAARVAVEVNPMNAPAPGVALPPQHIAALTSRYFGPKGAHLSVQFLDGGPADLRARVLEHANVWGEHANVSVKETTGRGDIRVTRTPGEGYYSFLGTDCLSIPAGQTTLNLDSFTMQTPESEWRRVVRHEFGHALLAAPHEHMRRQVVARIDVEKAVEYFWRTQGWDRQTVLEQVLTPLEEKLLLTPTPVDETSIMCYQLPGSITTDGQPIVGGLDINATDAGYAAKIYPLAIQPPPPPAETGIGLVIYPGRKSVAVPAGWTAVAAREGV